MKFAPETLMAYADGELDDQTREAIEAAMVADKELAQQIARHQAQRSELQAAFGGVLEERVPDRLIATAKNSPAGPTTDASKKVVDLNAARASKSQTVKRSWSWPEWTSIAATLLIGVVIGRNALQSPGSIVASNGRVVADGALASALSEQRSGGAPAESKVQIGLSFKAKTDAYCRTFTLQEESALAGVACRESNEWRVLALAEHTRAPTSDDYRMAGSELPPPIRQAIEDSIAGDALDAEEEELARANGWQD
jgi:hypothetical protein